MKLFISERTVGIFRGFCEGGLEFHADLTLPYKNEFQRDPMHGQFLLVQLDDEDEAVLGRITFISSMGRLTTPGGENYSLRAVAENRPVPEDLREQYLKYRVNMRVLGVVRVADNELTFAASHRRLPHVGSKVAFLTEEVLKEVVGHNVEHAAEIGYFALGEFVYAGDDKRIKSEPWMRIKSPAILPKFRVQHLVARRTLVFARAGFGKSNLVKYLFASLYSDTPTIRKRKGKHAPVGTVIFDPDGEYFWPDYKNRPGLCDVPKLQDSVVVFTHRKGPSAFYQSFVAGDVRLDIRRFRAADVVSVALPPENQEQQNVRKLKALSYKKWGKLVDLIDKHGNEADAGQIRELLSLEERQEAELMAARANVTRIVKMLHDPNSQLMDMLIESLRGGKLCIIDVSRMRGTAALVFSGLILQYIFNHNQEEFTKAEPEAIPVIAVVEEAQAVLGSKGSSGEAPFVSWVKEGRKYELGAVLVTQQPGAIPSEILSQGDNWFVFHLLSAGDLKAIKQANAHFSDDILSSLLNEPIPGHGVFWSSAGGRSYPVSIRVLPFEGKYRALDSEYNKPRVTTAATLCKNRFEVERKSVDKDYYSGHEQSGRDGNQAATDLSTEPEQGDGTDTFSKAKEVALRKFRGDKDYLDKIRKRGVPWRDVIVKLEGNLPKLLRDMNRIANALVPEAMTVAFGKEGEGWKTEKRPSKSNPARSTTYLIVIRQNDE